MRSKIQLIQLIVGAQVQVGGGGPATNGLKFWINDYLIRTMAHYLVTRVFLLKNNCVYDSSAK